MTNSARAHPAGRFFVARRSLYRAPVPHLGTFLPELIGPRTSPVRGPVFFESTFMHGDDQSKADLHTLRELQRDLEAAGKGKGYYHMPADTARKAGEALGRNLDAQVAQNEC